MWNTITLFTSICIICYCNRSFLEGHRAEQCFINVDFRGSIFVFARCSLHCRKYIKVTNRPLKDVLKTHVGKGFEVGRGDSGICILSGLSCQGPSERLAIHRHWTGHNSSLWINHPLKLCLIGKFIFSFTGVPSTCAICWLEGIDPREKEIHVLY